MKLRYAIYEWGMPLCFGILMYFLIGDYRTSITAAKLTISAKEFSGTSVGLLGVLVGFSIMVITLLNTSSATNIDKIKKTTTEFSIGKEKLSLFHLVLINFTYSVVVEIFGLIFNLSFPWILEKSSLISIKLLLCMDLFFAVHVLLLNLRNMTDFYFILFKKE